MHYSALPGKLQPSYKKCDRSRGWPQYTAMFAVDIASFSSRHADVQLYLRSALYEIVQKSCDASGVMWDDCHHEDRGDGILVVAHTTVHVEALLDAVVTQVRTRIRGHNEIANPAAQIRLRMAIHSGYIQFDQYGVSGPSVNLLFRLLEAPPLKKAFAAHEDDFMLIISEHLYDEVISFGPSLIDHDVFQDIKVKANAACVRGWLWPPSANLGGNACDR